MTFAKRLPIQRGVTLRAEVEIGSRARQELTGNFS
jgi:hypothetical protein